MAYDESHYRWRDPGGTEARGDPRFGGEAAYGDDAETRPSGYQSSRSVVADPGGSNRPVAAERGCADPPRHRSVAPAVLDDVFDDPSHGEPGRDRLVVHVIWELALLLVVAGVAFLLHRENPNAVRAAELDGLLVAATGIGLIALAAAMTLRAAVPNLAVGSVAVASALHFAENGDLGVAAAVLPAVLVAVIGGLALAVLVVGFHVPAWAGSLAAALAVIVFIQLRTGPVEVQGEYDPTRHAIYLSFGCVTLAFLGGLLGAIKTVRRSVGRFRPVGDPAHRRGAVAGVLAAVAITSSMLLATLAGVLIAAGGAGSVTPTTGLEWTGLAFGAALLGGTSAFGRRGGILGTLLAVAALTLFLRYDDERGLDIAPAAVAAAMLAAGLVVTRLVESYGRPGSAVLPDQVVWLAEEQPGQNPSAQPDSWTTVRWSER